MTVWFPLVGREHTVRATAAAGAAVNGPRVVRGQANAPVIGFVLCLLTHGPDEAFHLTLGEGQRLAITCTTMALRHLRGIEGAGRRRDTTCPAHHAVHFHI